jgi:carbon monoxide dehydrogenase subunit G
MKVENSFEVPAAREEAWDLLMDVPRIVPCMPGAELVETVDENSWKAKMAVKLGPIALNFAVDVVRETADPAQGSVKLNARAREMRGRGGAQAAIESSLSEVPGGTRVDIVTDLTMSGAVAQYGRGIVQDVAGQLTAQFAECLKAKLGPAAAAAASAGASGAEPEQPAAKPISGLSLGLKAIGHVVTGFLKQLFGRRPKS